MTAGARGVGLGDCQALAAWIVFAVYGNQGRYAETALVFFTDLRSRAFRRYHNDRDVVPDLHAFFNDIEAVGVRQAGAVLHQWHDLADDGAVLLVGREVEHQVS